MPAKPHALLVAPPGPGRRSTAATLEALGLDVRLADEPYEGTASFVERPADLVVLSLAAFRPRDMPFLGAVRRRMPFGRVLLLVPEGRRDLARRALRAGADLWLTEPYHQEELRAFVRCLLPVPSSRGPDLAGEAVRALSQELSHAVNNPLQVLSMLAEESKPTKASVEASREHLKRIRDAVRIVEGFGNLERPALREIRLGALVREAVEDAVHLGDVRLAGPPPKDGRPLSADPQQVRYAVDTILGFLTAVGPERPLPLKVGVHNPSSDLVEAAFKGRGVDLDRAAFRGYLGHVLCSHEESREPHPGLAPVALVARRHAGRLVARRVPGGTVLGLRLPVV